MFADGQIIEIAGGKLLGDATWTIQPKAAVKILETVEVEGGHPLHRERRVRVEGRRQAVDRRWQHRHAEDRRQRGGAGQLRGPREGQAWDGVDLYADARGTQIAYLDLSDVGNDAGITAVSGAVGKLDHVTCTRCAATLAPACGAKIEQTAVTASARHKVGVKKPDGC